MCEYGGETVIIWKKRAKTRLSELIEIGGENDGAEHVADRGEMDTKYNG
jgi:hypothetical protein